MAARHGGRRARADLRAPGRRVGPPGRRPAAGPVRGRGDRRPLALDFGFGLGRPTSPGARSWSSTPRTGRPGMLGEPGLAARTGGAQPGRRARPGRGEQRRWRAAEVPAVNLHATATGARPASTPGSDSRRSAATHGRPRSTRASTCSSTARRVWGLGVQFEPTAPGAWAASAATRPGPTRPGPRHRVRDPAAGRFRRVDRIESALAAPELARADPAGHTDERNGSAGPAFARLGLLHRRADLARPQPHRLVAVRLQRPG